MASAKVKERQIKWIKLEKLAFDPDNPRFAGLDGDAVSSDAEVIERMTEIENVQELMGSIGEQGYFDGEPLLVARVQNGGPERYTVVEGNRRLAALKLLDDAIESTKPSILALRAAAKVKVPEVPCLVFDQRREILRYLGYRHITGAKRWEPLPKARYLQQLRDEFFRHYPLEEQFKALAREIGSRSDYVAQMLAGLNVYDQCQERAFFSLSGVTSENVDFSLLTTALSYVSISEYIGLEGRTDVDGESLNLDRCRDLFFWMYSPQEDGATILGESRNLRKLAAAVKSSEAVLSLKQKKDLDHAFLLSEGPAVAFSKVLAATENKLRNALDLVHDVPRLDASHLMQSERLVSLAEDLASVTRRNKRRQASEEDV